MIGKLLRRTRGWFFGNRAIARRSNQKQPQPIQGQPSVSLILHWLGIGDIIVCGAILRGLHRQHSGHAINFYLHENPEVDARRFVDWGRLVWPSAQTTETADLPGKVYEIGRPNDPNADPERLGIEGLRHDLWAELCETEAVHYRIHPSGDAVEKARSLLEELGVDISSPLVYFSPVTANEWRNWPIENWRHLERLLNEQSIQVVMGALKPEPWATREQLSSFSTRAFLGRHAPDVLLGVLHQCSCIVSNDSGFAHLGGILDKPTVAICGGNYDGFACYGWYSSVHVVQADSRKIVDIPVEDVFLQVQNCLQQAHL